MTRNTAVPMPPFALREMVGAPGEEFFDNPNGAVPYSASIPADSLDAVFDFGCGCGRLARQLLQMKQGTPRRYVGIDINREMIQWCQANLTPVNPTFQFFHHDVWSPGYGRGNSPKMAEPFPVEDGAFSLFFANSVFTHVYKEQAEYYLHEVARILRPDGVAVTTWFFFDNISFPMFHGVSTLFTSEVDPTSATIYDRHWFIDAIRRARLAVRKTTPPRVAGHQWWLQLERRRPDSVDNFPLGEEGAEWLCGATMRPIAAPLLSPEEIEQQTVGSKPAPRPEGRPDVPPMSGLALAQWEIERLKHSWTWKIGHAITGPARKLYQWMRPIIRS